ncbi:hybrid-cluster NAD(P)-dependent oxidoreductase, partial [Mycobacterium tuberculosis]|nr:hybrid-cluster NAD(P)-dependent oxidoreductase [Mycobacterium tuberculosis]MBR7503918.1 hybrid-cluster NAD(P)-dependent oxidoreductase [Mycobacterium tuberculosis]
AYLHDRLRVGDRLHVDGPYGLFSTSFHPARRHLFVSAGSGITPIMSMVRALLARNPPETIDIVLLHSA